MNERKLSLSEIIDEIDVLCRGKANADPVYGVSVRMLASWRNKLAALAAGTEPTQQQIMFALCKAWESCGCTEPCFSCKIENKDSDNWLDFDKMADAVRALFNQ